VRELIIASTEAALLSISNPRYFKSERGYQGIFYCKLHDELDSRDLLTEDRIIEMEYQKSDRHGMSQRPDIIFHIPVELSGADRNENNYAVWAFKVNANQGSAQEDFEKLDQMFGVLNYPLGFFINIRTDQNHMNIYGGQFRDGLLGYSVWLQEGSPRFKKAWFEGNAFKELLL
jgi:hypothetical protein